MRFSSTSNNWRFFLSTDSYCCFTRCIGGKNMVHSGLLQVPHPTPALLSLFPWRSFSTIWMGATFAGSFAALWQARTWKGKGGKVAWSILRLGGTGKGTGSECSYYGYTLILSSANGIEWPKVLDSRHKWHHWRLAPGAPNKASQYGSTKFPYL